MSDEKQASTKMKLIRLGQTSLMVSELCLGSMTFDHKEGTNSWGLPVVDKGASFKLMDAFVERGGNFIDTANVYGPCASEEVIGEWMEERGNREQIVIATKGRFQWTMDANSRGNGRKALVAALNASLKRLRTSYIDLYQLHSWDAQTPIEETMRTLNDMVRQGTVRYIGVSNFNGWQLQKAMDYAKQYNMESFVSLQPQYSLMCRDIEADVLQVAKNFGMGVLPWSPLKGGWLTGRYDRDSAKKLAGSRLEFGEKSGWSETDWKTQGTEFNFCIIDELKKIAGECGKSMGQVSLNWLLQKGTIPLIGARKMHHLVDNMGAVGWKLTDEQMARLDTVSQPPLPYPYRMQLSHLATGR